MRRPPSFQFYPADFLSDEHVVLMTNQELGCYIKLLCYCWREGSIPNDISRIARLCGETSEIMAELWTAISSCFIGHEFEPNRLINLRLENERKKQLEHRKERSESGKKGAISRWSKSNGIAIAKPKAKPMANDGSSSSSSYLKKDMFKSTGFEQFYEAYPKHQGRKKALSAWQKLKPDMSLQRTILEALEGQKSHKEHLRKSGEFCPAWPLPATWLNGQRWEDEIPDAKEETSGRVLTEEDIQRMREE